MAGSGTSLAVREVDVHYGRLKVLDHVSLHASGGEFIAMLGSSGCGKTTLLRAVCGFVQVTSGAIEIEGRDVAPLPPDKRDVAMVFQSYALWPHMSVAQNIGYGLKLRGVDRAAVSARVAELLAMMRLDGLAERKVTALSGGQRQRVALARALAINPRILLLDEPLSNLDARVREDVRHEIKTLQKSLGITTLHVTHDREEAMMMADRIAILDAGRIVQVGSPEELYERPNSPFVARFMGAGNAVHLTIEDGAIAAGPSHARTAIAGELAPHRRAALAGGPVTAFFRSQDARLTSPDEPGLTPPGLMLRGEVVQASYSGGFFRYAVQVGQDRFLIDDARRHQVGDTVGVSLPLDALHVYPDAAPASQSPGYQSS